MGLWRFKSWPSSDVRGGGILGLLIVVAIILIVLIVANPLSRDDQALVNRAPTTLGQAEATACRENLRLGLDQLTRMQLANPGGAITVQSLEKMGKLKPCPGQGEIVIQNGRIYCKKHAPPLAVH